MTPFKNTTKDPPHLGLWFGLGGLLLGMLDLWILSRLGLELAQTSTVSVGFIGGFLSVSFAIFGALWGLALEARKRAEQLGIQKQEALMQLAEIQNRVSHSEKLAALGQVSASIAHEVRNPLAIIRTQVQNLEEDLAGGTAIDPQSFQVVVEEIDRLTRVIDTVNRFAKPIKPNTIAISAEDIATRLGFLVQSLFPGNHNRLKLQFDSQSDPHFQSDPDLVCQVLLGLVVNALEMTPDGQTVTLEFGGDSDSVRFCVIDRGPGIAEEVGDQIFQPFFTTKQQGNGLGLTIAKDIAKKLKGNLALSPGPDKGARFCLYLPRSPKEG